jgi:hypothetical protein
MTSFSNFFRSVFRQGRELLALPDLKQKSRSITFGDIQ